jgi:phosphoglucosamine mutase
MSERKLFGTDGIRGRANVDPMTPELALRLGRAITLVAARGKTRPPRIVIGKDTRVSGYMLETAIAAGICAAGGRVMLSGPIPTPAVANLTQSHNPFADNGIKLFGPDGFKLPDAEEAAIEALLEDPKLDSGGKTGASIGRAERLDSSTGRYIVYAKNTFPKELTLDGVKVVVDAAHGAAYRVAPAVFHELGADVTCIGCKPNGVNINRNCGALHPEHVAAEVKKRKAQLGVALDGDADRVIFVDEHGKIVDGDAIMALVGTRMHKAGKLNKGKLVTTVMSNMGLERALESVGGTVMRTNVGDRYVVEALRGESLSFGGEQSGHLIFMDHATTGDGVVAALQVIAIMVAEQKSLADLAHVMERVPQVLESIKLPARRPLEQMPELTSRIGAAEKQLGRDGRVLVRWSGTEAKLRLMVEGPDPVILKTLVDDMADAARKDLTA